MAAFSLLFSRWHCRKTKNKNTREKRKCGSLTVALRATWGRAHYQPQWRLQTSIILFSRPVGGSTDWVFLIARFSSPRPRVWDFLILDLQSWNSSPGLPVIDLQSWTPRPGPPVLDFLVLDLQSLTSSPGLPDLDIQSLTLNQQLRTVPPPALIRKILFSIKAQNAAVSESHLNIAATGIMLSLPLKAVELSAG